MKNKKKEKKKIFSIDSVLKFNILNLELNLYKCE